MTQRFSARFVCYAVVVWPIGVGGVAATAQDAQPAAPHFEPPAAREPLLAFRRQDSNVRPVAEGDARHAVEVSPPAPPLQTPAGRRLSPATHEQNQPEQRPTVGLPIPLPAKQMLLSSGAGLAIVVGLVLACAWLVRRGGARPSDQLPEEALAVLGKAPLFGQTMVHLIRLGNKLVLVAATPDRLQPIAEIDDREEVERLAGICLASRSHSSAAEFQAVLQQLAREPAKGFLGSHTTGGRG